MKLFKLLLFAPAILVATGCATHEQREAKYDESLWPYPTPVATGRTEGAMATRNFEQYTHGGTYSASPSMGASAETESGAATGASKALSTEDSSLVSHVRQALAEEATLATIVPNIQVGANKGTVTLAGTVQDSEQKDAIGELVENTPGVESVDNQIQVSQSASTQSTSRDEIGAISQDESTRNAASNEVNNATQPLTPTSRDSDSSEQTNAPGALGGTSTRPDQQSRVYETNGTNSAISPFSTSGQYPNGGVNVTVQGISQTDRTLAQQISQELRTDASLASAVSQMSISVNDGRVTLRGTVPNEEQKKQIASAIQRVTGVQSVDDQLQVGTGQPMPANR